MDAESAGWVPSRGQGLLIAGLLAVLAGCASPRPEAAAAATLNAPAVPTAWTALAPNATTSAGTAGAGAAANTSSLPQASGASLAAWWQRFGDATLDALLTRALDAATDAQAARARLRQARAARDLAAAGLTPTLGANASAQASRAEGGATTRQYRAGFDAAWEVDLWGAGRAGVSAAEADLRASAATLGQTQVTLAAEVAVTYIELRSAQARLVTTQTSLASQEHTLRLTQWREEAGLVNRLDVEQQRTTVAQTQAQLPALQASIEQAMNALAVLTGVAPGALHARLAAAAPLPAAPASLALAIPAAVLSQRADVAAAESRWRAAIARVEQVDAQRLPSLQLSGSIGLAALGVSALYPGAGVASLLAGIQWPLFDGGRVRARVQAQQAVLDEAQVIHRATVLAALQEVEDTLVALRAAGEQQARQHDAAAAARRAAALAEQRYAAGLVDITSVLLTQRTLLAAEDALATTTAAVATQHVRLFKALGGGWTPDALAADAGASAPERNPRP
ncbi:MAG: efflux transporter outer membrane subunit [Rubrivivax sp.]|nr:efflux transporter outer membrane subunit [Rubrivivax sp.]